MFLNKSINNNDNVFVILEGRNDILLILKTGVNIKRKMTFFPILDAGGNVLPILKYGDII